MSFWGVFIWFLLWDRFLIVLFPFSHFLLEFIIEVIQWFLILLLNLMNLFIIFLLDFIDLLMVISENLILLWSDLFLKILLKLIFLDLFFRELWLLLIDDKLERTEIKEIIKISIISIMMISGIRTREKWISEELIVVKEWADHCWYWFF